mgnify:CR=1 FL=1
MTPFKCSLLNNSQHQASLSRPSQRFTYSLCGASKKRPHSEMEGFPFGADHPLIQFWNVGMLIRSPWLSNNSPTAAVMPPQASTFVSSRALATVIGRRRRFLIGFPFFTMIETSSLEYQGLRPLLVPCTNTDDPYCL